MVGTQAQVVAQMTYSTRRGWWTSWSARDIRRPAGIAGTMGLLALLAGCSVDGLLKSELPPDLTDPAVTKTREGVGASKVHFSAPARMPERMWR